jgi:glutamate decarboxylase
VHYLSGEMRNFGLNFSRASSNVVQQYYNFLHLGRSGYAAVMRECLATAQWIAQSLTAQACFQVVSNPRQMPVVAIRLRPGYTRFTLAVLAETLKRKGWIVPVYHLPANIADIEVLRIVVKPEFTRAAAKTFLQDLVTAIAELAPTPARTATREGFGWPYARQNREVLS